MTEFRSAHPFHSPNILAREGFAPRPGSGRHRAPSTGLSMSGKAASVAVAAGAVLVAGPQLATPATANADLAHPVANPLIPGLPFEMPQLPKFEMPAVPKVELPQFPEAQKQIQDGFDQARAWGEGLIGNVTPHPQIVRPTNGQITSGFGPRWGGFHYGLDFASPIGTPIHSVESGNVISAGPASGFGLWVRVRQDDGTIAVYGHVNDILTHVGARVNSGDVIATVGNRGWSTGPHLHLEIWDQSGRKVNPAPWLASHGVALGWGAANA